MKSVEIRFWYAGSDKSIVQEWGVDKENKHLFVKGLEEGTWYRIKGTDQFSATTPKNFMCKLRTKYLEGSKIRMVRGSACGW